MEALQRNIPVTALTSVTTAPTTGSTFALPSGNASKVTYITNVSASLTSLSLVHEVSLDNSVFKTVATDGTTGTTSTFETSANFYRARIAAGTGAATITVTVVVAPF